MSHKNNKPYDLNDDEAIASLAELYEPFFVVVRAFQEECELTDGEAGLLLMFSRFLAEGGQELMPKSSSGRLS